MRRHILTALFLVLVSTGITCCAESTEIKITNPLDGAIISQSIEMEGTSKDIPVGQALWIMVYPQGVNRYYPQDKRDFPIDVMANGDWSGQAIVGSAGDSDLKFKLFAVLADENANKEIIDYLDECKALGSWPGMETLPEGAIPYDKVSVTRERPLD